MKEDLSNDTLANNVRVIKPHEGEKLEANGVELTFKVTSDLSRDQLGVYDMVLAPKAIGARMHYHRFMDETFIVNKGTLTVETMDGDHQAGPGTVIYIPRLTPHGFRNDSDRETRLMLLFNPSQQREGFFRELYRILEKQPVDPGRFLKLYDLYDSFPLDANNILPVKAKGRE